MLAVCFCKGCCINIFGAFCSLWSAKWSSIKEEKEDPQRAWYIVKKIFFKKSHISLFFCWKKGCVMFVFQSLKCTCRVSHDFEPGLVALFHQLQCIPGCEAGVSAGQRPGSDGRICKATYHPKDSNRGHLVQERAGWRRPHICSSSHGRSVPGI